MDPPRSDGPFAVSLASAAPKLQWLRTFLAVPPIFMVCCAGFEIFWRGLGYAPNVRDSAELWYFWRNRIRGNDHRVVVLLGTSRITSDISLDTMHACLPGYQVIQLGLSGPKSCIGILRDFLEDPHFKGIVICDLDTPLLDRSHSGDHVERRAYRPESRLSLLAAITGAWLSERSSMFRTDLRLRDVARCAFWVAEPECSHTTFARETPYDFSAVQDIDALRRRKTRSDREEYQRHRFPKWEDLRGDVAEIDALTESLRARGGLVIFVRFPSWGERLALEEQYYSRSSGWDRFAARTTSPCIHFADVPGMQALRCPDGSHLDQRDVPRFTTMLFAEMRRRGLFG